MGGLMNYREDFERCFDYIERHIEEKLSSAILAANMGYSLFHFCRVFQVYKGMTPSEYILKRKLDRSLIDIMAGGKVLDIAIRYGFETSSGYAKAFRKVYKMSPTEYAHKMNAYRPSEKIEVYNYMMPPKIIELEAFTVTGYGVTTDISSDEYTGELVAFWKQYDEENIEEKMYEELTPNKHGEIGVAIPNGTSSGKMLYIIGVMAAGDSDQKWHAVSIPAGLYAVFTTPPIDMTKGDNLFAEVIKKTWQYIFGTWLETSSYVYDESRYDFEYYDERCHYLVHSVMDIYIPIR